MSRSVFDDWLAELKVGDNVVRRVGFRNHRLTTIERVTATQFVLKDGGRARRVNGRIMGVTDNTRLEIPTPMLVEKIEHAKPSDWLGRTQPTLLQLKAMKKAHDDNA